MPLATECVPEQAAFAAVPAVDYLAACSSSVASASPDDRSSPEAAPLRDDCCRDDSVPDGYSADSYSADLGSAGSSPGGCCPNSKAASQVVPAHYSPGGLSADSAAADSAGADWVEADSAELRSAAVDWVAVEYCFREHSPDDYFPAGSVASADSVVRRDVPLPDSPQAAHCPDALPACSAPDAPYSAWQVLPEAQPSPPDEPSPPDAGSRLHFSQEAVPDAQPAPAAAWQTTRAQAEAFASLPPAGS